MRSRTLVVMAAALLLASVSAGPASTTAQESDLIALHEAAVYGMVVVRVAGGAGSGWLLERAGERPLLVTNAHVAVRVGATLTAELYGGAGRAVASVPCRVTHVSSAIDLGVATLLADPPPSARPLTLETSEIRRGARVVLAGNPGPLTFQTTEGVVTGVTSEETRVDGMCGRARNCLVVDAASFSGSSGGPAIDRAGRVVGMLWGGPTSAVEGRGMRSSGVVANSSFAYLLHAQTIADELAVMRSLEQVPPTAH